jgi:putative redox protein
MGKITSYHKGDMLLETRVGNHTVVNDVPSTPAWGGKDRAPTPPDYLMVSLSSCVAAFVVQYCANSGINTQDMSVDVTFDKEEKPAFLKNIRVKVNLPHAEITDRKDAVRRVCEHCTVHETLTRLDRINIEVTDKNTPSD